MTIDAHVHLYDTQRSQGVPFPKPEDRLIYRPMLPADLRQVAEPAGVRGAVLVEASPWIEDNDWVLDLVANEPFICAVVGNLDPEAAEFPALLERFARNPRFRGIRIRQGRPLAFGHPQLRGNLQALAAMRCTMEVVMRGADLERLAHLAAEMPGLRIMLNHLAFVKVTGEPPDAAWVAAMERFSGLPNVFCKVSRFTEQAAIQPAPLDAAYYAPVFDVVWAVFGPDRLAYGSNWPPCLNVGDYRGTVDLARDYFRVKGADALAKVMGRNAAAFYGGPGFPALHALGDA